MSDLFFEQGYVKISIRESKTDTYRRGNEIIIAKTGNKLCPVSWLNKYILKAGLSKDSSEYLFTAINYSSKSDTYKATNKNKGLSYTRAREIFLSSLKTLALDPKKYCLHSLRSGGASAAANNQVPDRLIKAHGRWVTDIAKDGYIKDDLPNKILVSLNLVRKENIYFRRHEENKCREMQKINILIYRDACMFYGLNKGMPVRHVLPHRDVYTAVSYPQQPEDVNNDSRQYCKSLRKIALPMSDR
ncbi:hypothetical protein KUTeg_024270 [Tegillarca granosa]|uniref:Uncharacterized protein n=1 Tax=Tegillarca granosa TaxID=220873 RepID=A0ABQ9DWU2_TEGGR|nr:hypothetical protein KUTeg_024270 [Tegillarca granosa]